MGLFKRLFGICATPVPADPSCWSFSNGRLEVVVDKAPELATNGGAIRLEGRDLPRRLLLVRDHDGVPRAFANKCTHGGRRLDPLPGSSEVQCCSVGKTTFDADGKVLSGSGKEDIPTWDVVEEGGKLIIELK